MEKESWEFIDSNHSKKLFHLYFSWIKLTQYKSICDEIYLLYYNYRTRFFESEKIIELKNYKWEDWDIFPRMTILQLKELVVSLGINQIFKNQGIIVKICKIDGLKVNEYDLEDSINLSYSDYIKIYLDQTEIEFFEEEVEESITINFSKVLLEIYYKYLNKNSKKQIKLLRI